MKCDRCGAEAVTFLRYSGAHLCAQHFAEFVRRRVSKEVRKEVVLHTGDTLAVAVSGGKDSMVLLSLLNGLFGDRNGIRLVAVTIDEGLVGYRPPSIDIVRRYCADHGIEHRIRAFTELGLTMDEVAPLCTDGTTPCSYCGVFRRKLMNDEARQLGAKYLATGHNLDDIAQSVMMDFTRGDIDRLARLGPHTHVRPGLIPRCFPLRMVPEKETLLYALVEHIPFWDGECPYWQAALRNEYRDLVDNLERRTPGARHSIVSSY
ncbi:MAG: tRNA 2-thiocytidine biosynthesis TtcA family protein, partial [Candidatus Methanomethylophilus sp.]|nr:tRNA 2-thiocytidine biosynthesis TtcA family protein [Methanomethylophilus sp.]